MLNNKFKKNKKKTPKNQNFWTIQQITDQPNFTMSCWSIILKIQPNPKLTSWITLGFKTVAKITQIYV